MSSVHREASATTGSSVAHTAVAENVAVKSTVQTETQSKVSMANTQKMATLMSKLGKRIFFWKIVYVINCRYNSSTN